VSPLEQFESFKKDAWSISANWRIAENHFEINKSSGELKFELPIDMRIESHKPTKMQIESGIYESTVNAAIEAAKRRIEREGRNERPPTPEEVWPQHEDDLYHNLKVGDIQVSGKIKLKEVAGSWEIVIKENEDVFKLVLNIKEKTTEVFKNTEKVWNSTVDMNTENWIDFSFSNVDDKLFGKVGSASFEYQYVNEKLVLETSLNGFHFQVKDS
jgi:hypothetical protein